MISHEIKKIIPMRYSFRVVSIYKDNPEWKNIVVCTPFGTNLYRSPQLKAGCDEMLALSVVIGVWEDSAKEQMLPRGDILNKVLEEEGLIETSSKKFMEASHKKES